jgi:O-antigen/teichoic acid export membrane protein
MLDKIKRLGTETAVYGLSTVLGRFLTFLLTPLYANVLAPGDLGVVATLYAYIAFLNVVYHAGMDSAYMKYVSTLELADRKSTFTVPFLFVLFVSIIVSGLIALNSTSLAAVAGIPQDSFIMYSAWILMLDGVAILPFSALRMQRKAMEFSMIKLSGIVINVVCTVLLLVEYKMGVTGIFLAGVISSAATLVMLSPTIVRNCIASWPQGLLGKLLSFGLPTVPAGLASIAIQVVDRPILEAMTDQATVGVYQANYRLGILMMLVVSMFEFAWRPFFFSHAKDIDAKQLFARVLTYVLLAMIILFLLMVFFLDDIIKLPLFFGYSILPDTYWSGLPIVPIVLLGYIFLGAAIVFSAGVYIEKKTKQLPAVTFLGAGVNIAVNLLLIPVMGIVGAALATMLSYGVMAVVMFWIGQRSFPIQYEWRRIAIITGTTALVCALYFLVEPPVQSILWRIALLFAWGYSMYRMKFFRSSELSALRRLFRWSNMHSTPVPPSETLD